MGDPRDDFDDLFNDDFDSMFEELESIEGVDGGDTNSSSDTRSVQSEDRSKDTIGNSKDTISTKGNTKGNKAVPKKRGGSKSVKTALVSVGLGTALLVVGLASSRAMGNDNNKGNNSLSTKDIESTTQVNTDTQENSSVDLGNSNSGSIEVTNKPVQTSTDWVEISGDTVISNTYTIDATMTVTDIKYYAMVSSSSTRQVKAEILGNISGLVGTYGLEIPYDKAVILNNGDAFNVKVTIEDKEGYKVIADINY